VRFPEGGMSETGADDVSRAQDELGTPDATFQISRRRFILKLWGGLALIAGSIVAIIGMIVVGFFEASILAKVILTPLIFGIFMLVHMYRQRGLTVLVYPTGLLRLRRGEVDSFPWDEVAAIRIKIQRLDSAEAIDFDHDADGSLVACCVPVEVPSVQFWKSWVAIERTDGATEKFGPALSDFDHLAELIQRRTFSKAWRESRDRLFSGEIVAFGDLLLTPEGLRHTNKKLPWRDLKELIVAQGRLSVKKTSGWLPWLVLDVTKVPNPHVLFALVGEAKRFFRKPVASQLDHDQDPHPTE